MSMKNIVDRNPANESAPLGSAAVDKSAAGSCFCSALSTAGHLRKQCPDHSGEHITASTGCKSGRSGCTNVACT